MRYTVELSFMVDETDDEGAWKIADALEKWADNKGFSGVITTVVDGEDGRAVALGPEGGEVPLTSADSVEPNPGQVPMRLGVDGEFVTIGDDDGNMR